MIQHKYLLMCTNYRLPTQLCNSKLSLYLFTQTKYFSPQKEDTWNNNHFYKSDVNDALKNINFIDKTQLSNLDIASCHGNLQLRRLATAGNVGL